MNLHEYFRDKSGFGVISTSNNEGEVNSAVYAKPHINDDNTVAFIMRDRLTHNNINENPYATFMFIEDSAGYKGVRLYLKKVKEDDNAELIAKMTRQSLSPEEDAAMGPKFIVYFQVEKALKLVGGDDVVLD